MITYVLAPFKFTFIHIILMSGLMSVFLDEFFIDLFLEISIFFGLFIFLLYVIFIYTKKRFVILSEISSSKILFYFSAIIYILILLLSLKSKFTNDALIYPVWVLCFVLTVTLSEKIKMVAFKILRRKKGGE